MIDKREKLIICGKSGAGKDFLLRGLVDKGLTPAVKITTRPKRSNEIEGVNYNFVSSSKFESMKVVNELVVSQEFINDKGDKWGYGISRNDFFLSQVSIMTPGEINQISPEIRKNCFVVYLDIDRGVREGRILNRNDNNDSVLRRLNSDDQDFHGFNDFDLKITDPEFDTETVLSLME